MFCARFSTVLHLYQPPNPRRMSETIYDQIEIEDFTFDPDTQLFTYPCPCGDRFQISIYDMQEEENIAVCPSCSLMVEIIFEPSDLEEYLDQI